MAVFRIERTRDYTVMSNHHLRNHELSLKAKGLLSMMLSLPDDWNYTTRGLAKICKEGVDAIGSSRQFQLYHLIHDASGYRWIIDIVDILRLLVQIFVEVNLYRRSTI
mgnify:CR=1 FL=1